MQIGLLGYGTVGKAFYALTEEQPGLTCRALLTRRPRGTGALETDDFAAILNDPAIDTVVELIGGIHPAYDYIAAALQAQKNVVTANKAVVCAYYPELIRLATENGVCLRCTAAAGGGIPWLCSLGRAARMDRITAVEGILNGTTNYIVSEMTARSAGYGELLKEAQRLGYAEADPTDDVEGYDARRAKGWGGVRVRLPDAVPNQHAGGAHQRQPEPRFAVCRAHRQAELFRRGRGRLSHRVECARGLHGDRAGRGPVLQRSPRFAAAGG